MKCEQNRNWLAVRRELSPAQDQAVQQHLLSCRDCAGAWQREERSLAALRSLRVTPLPAAGDTALPLQQPNLPGPLPYSAQQRWNRFVVPRAVRYGLSTLPFVLIIGLLLILLPSPRGSETRLHQNPNGPAGSLAEPSTQTPVATAASPVPTTATPRPITQADLTATMAAGRAIALTQMPVPTPTLFETPAPTYVMPTPLPLTATAEARTSVAQTQTALAYISPTAPPPPAGYPAPVSARVVARQFLPFVARGDRAIP